MPAFNGQLRTASGRPVKSYPMPDGWHGRPRGEVIRAGGAWGNGRYGTPWYAAATQALPEPSQVRTNAGVRRRAVRLMLADEAVKAGLQQKLFGVMQLDLQSTPDDPDSPEDRQAAEFVHYAVTRRLKGGVRELAWNVLHGSLFDGMSVCEPVWRMKPDPVTPGELVPDLEDRGKFRGKHCLSAVKAKDPDWYTPEYDDFGNLTAILPNGWKDPPPEVTDPARYLVFTHLPIYSSPAGWADLDAAYRHFYIKVNALRMRDLFFDKLTGPFIIGTGTGQNTATFDAKLKEARGCGWIRLNPGEEVQVTQLIGSGDRESFDRFIDACNRAILISLIGAYLHVLEGATPNAAGNTREHRGVAELIIWYLSAAVADVLTDQLAPMLVRQNYRTAGVPRLTLSAVDPADTRQFLENANLARQAGLRLSKKQLYSHGFDVPKDDEDALEPPQAAPPGGGDAGGLGLPFAEGDGWELEVAADE